MRHFGKTIAGFTALSMALAAPALAQDAAARDFAGEYEMQGKGFGPRDTAYGGTCSIRHGEPGYQVSCFNRDTRHTYTGKGLARRHAVDLHRRPSARRSQQKLRRRIPGRLSTSQRWRPEGHLGSRRDRSSGQRDADAGALIAVRAVSGPEQKPPALVDRRRSHGAQVVIGGAADRMADGGERMVRHAEHAAHHLGGTHEPGGHHAEGGNAEAFGCH